MEQLTADLVLEGGGVLGIAHVGALTVLEGAGYHIHRVAGASAGSIVGALVAAGMPAARMAEVMQSLDYRRFTDRSLLDRVPLVGPVTSVLLDNGVYEGEALREWLGNQLADLGVETFADLRLDDDQVPPDQRYRLVVTASDVTRGELVRFPWDYRDTYGLDPDRQRVVDAVRASMSVPFFYEPASITAADGTRSTLLDGGLLSNFPVDLLDRTDGAAPRFPTFGVQLLGHLPQDAGRVVPVAGLLQHGPVALAADLVMTAIVGHDQAHLDKPWVRSRTIVVDTDHVHPLDFGLSHEQVMGLYDAGVTATRRFLAGWDWPAYLARFGQR